MPKSKFGVWLDLLEKQQLRMKRNYSPLCPQIVETSHVAGKTVTIELGTKYQAVIDGQVQGPGQLRSLYTDNKETFASILEAITDRVDEVVQGLETVLGAIAAEAIPGAVMSRIKGEKLEEDNMSLIQGMVEKKSKEILSLLDRPPFSFVANLKPVAGSEIGLEADLGEASPASFKWGTHWATELGLTAPLTAWTFEPCTLFLANFDLIKIRVQEFLDALEPARKLCQPRQEE